jgi:hypothetical protein
MAGRRRKILIVIAISAICVTGILLFFPIIFFLSDYLSKTEKVNANLLIVEGWLPQYAIEMAYDEFENNSYDLVVTTGLKISGYYLVSMNGFLVFHTHDKCKGNVKIGDHLIEVDAYSEMKDKNSAHFNVFINDSIVADFFADKKKRKYEIIWNGNLSKIDSVMIQFDNDSLFEYGDRNLYIKEIIIDYKTHFSFQNNSYYDIGALDGKKRVNNNFTSFSELARNKLLSMGIDSSLVLSIPCNRVNINRTLTSALAFRDWLKTSNFKVKGINIVSLGSHARRTWLSYTKVLDKSYNIGIVSFPDRKGRFSRKYKVLQTLRETLGFVYYWIILIPY